MVKGKIEKQLHARFVKILKKKFHENFDKTLLKLFPNIPFDYHFIPWVTNYTFTILGFDLLIVYSEISRLMLYGNFVISHVKLYMNAEISRQK